MIIKIVMIGIVITIVSSIFLDKNFFNDAIDSIRNILEPPEIDPMPSAMKMLVEREKGFEYLDAWINTLDQMQYTEQPYCYSHLPATTIESREEDISIILSTTQQDSFQIRMSQKGAAVSREITINKPLCLIAQPTRSATNNREARDILENFREAFYSNDEQKKQECLNNPENCALLLSNPGRISTQYATNDGFYAQLMINSMEIKDKRTSFSLSYYVLKNEESHEVFNFNSGRLSDAGYLLFKLSDYVCIMPLASTSNYCEPWLWSNSRATGDVRLLRRSCFFERGLEEPTQELQRIPECDLTKKPEQETKQETDE